jgi:hypothetical protein
MPFSTNPLVPDSLKPQSKLFRSGIQVASFRNPELEHAYRDKGIEAMALAARSVYAHSMPYAQYSEQAILSAMFGNCCGAVRTTINAASTAQTTINTGSLANAGASGNMDQTPANTAMIWTGKAGSGTTINQYTNPHAFLLTAAAATSLTIASQSIGLAITAGDFIFLGGGSAASGATTSIPSWQLNQLFIGLTTQAVSGATQANVLSGEPTSTGGYARIGAATTTPTPLWNNQANWPLPTAASPSVLTTGNGPWSFAQSTAAWSTGSTNLVQMFIADVSTLAGGNVLAFGALGVAQAVNAASITLSFANAAITITLT